MHKIVKIIIIFSVFIAGVALGGFLFSRSIDRSFISLQNCGDKCFKSNELAGLLVSVGIQTMGGNLPRVVYETDKTLVFDIQYPYPPNLIHYLVVPKKDIKEIALLTEDDKAYLDDSYAVMGNIVRENNYTKYRVITNGSGYQEVAYLHFHLVIGRD